MIHEFKSAIPVITEHGEGYAIYVDSNGMFENDIWCIVSCEGGVVRHYRTDQFTVHTNSTYGIIKKP